MRRIDCLNICLGSRWGVSLRARRFPIPDSPFRVLPFFVVQWIKSSLILPVDQSERRWDAHLPAGISPASERVATVAQE